MLSSTVYSIEDLRRWHRAGRPESAAFALAVLGDPVAHSASPPMQNAAISHWNLPYEYIRLHVSPINLTEALDLLSGLAFVGVNLTIPHKAAVLPLLNQVDSHASMLGVVNTVTFREGLRLGLNTDGPGLVRAVLEDFDLRLGRSRVLITGAGGGAGRAAAIQCVMEGCSSLILVNRTLSKVQALSEDLRLLAAGSPAPLNVLCLADHDPRIVDSLRDVDLVLQCSSVGMQPSDPSPLPREALHSKLRVYDMIYSNKTRLLIDAEHAGAKTSNGLSMLLHQGALAFEGWFNREAPVDKMRAALLAAVNS